MSDVTLKVYHTGKLKGKYAVFFESKKAKFLFDSLNLILNGAKYVMAGKIEDTDKVKKFLANRQLTVTEVIIK